MVSLTEQPAGNKKIIEENSRYPTSIKGACFTPLSFFHRLLDLEYTQLRCFALITVETLGANRPTVELTNAQFAETLRVSEEWVSNAISQLEAAGLIRVGRSFRHASYSIREEYIEEAHKAGRETVRGKCPDCNTIGEFSTEFIPTPHQALRKLGGCVNSAVFRVVMVVIRYTVKWGKEIRALEVEPSELSLNDFTRLTGLENREITNGLTQAIKLGLIGRELRQGRPSLFWAIPEAFGSLERREPRKVQQPERKQEAKPKAPKNDEIPNENENAHENESRPYLYGRCLKCKHLVPVEPVTEEEFQEAQSAWAQSKAPPRAGPSRETGKKTLSQHIAARASAAVRKLFPEY